MKKLSEEDVQWVVNNIAELGVKIGDQFFFLYKGRSLDYNENDDGKFDPGAEEEQAMKWRPVGKREFGECCHPWDSIKRKTGEERLPETYVGFHGESPDEWYPLPRGGKDVP